MGRIRNRSDPELIAGSGSATQIYNIRKGLRIKVLLENCVFYLILMVIYVEMV